MRPALVIISSGDDAGSASRNHLYATDVKGIAAVATAARRVGAKTVVYNAASYTWAFAYSEDAAGTPHVDTSDADGQCRSEMESTLAAIDPTALIIRISAV